MLQVWSLLAKGICFKIGKCDKVNYWEDPWIPISPDFVPKPRLNALDSYGMVSSLKNSNGDWDFRKLENLFDHESVENINKMFWVNNEQEDKIIWAKTKLGLFSVKSAYQMEEGTVAIDSTWWKHLWRSSIHERTKLFL